LTSYGNDSAAFSTVGFARKIPSNMSNNRCLDPDEVARIFMYLPDDRDTSEDSDFGGNEGELGDFVGSTDVCVDKILDTCTASADVTSRDDKMSPPRKRSWRATRNTAAARNIPSAQFYAAPPSPLPDTATPPRSPHHLGLLPDFDVPGDEDSESADDDVAPVTPQRRQWRARRYPDPVDYISYLGAIG
jgi:hypothetical protein